MLLFLLSLRLKLSRALSTAKDVLFAVNHNPLGGKLASFQRNFGLAVTALDEFWHYFFISFCFL
jgi:hypothetical protein